MKIKIKFNNKLEPKVLLQVLYKYEVHCSNIVEKKDCFVAFCDRNASNVFTSACLEALKELNCLPIVPDELKCARSAIIFNCDTMITQYTEDQIKKDIEECNDINVLSVIKLNKKSIKIEFQDESTCKRVVTSGIFMFHLSIPVSCITQDIHIDVVMCYSCYKLDDHIGKDCPNKGIKLCSVCSSNTHRHLDCQSNVKKCLNCNGPHNTLALSCPERKKVISQKRSTHSKDNSTYSSKTKMTNVNSVAQPTPALSRYTSKQVSVFTDLCLKISIMNEQANKGTFESTLNELLKANGLSTFNMGTVQPPTFTQPADFKVIENLPSSQDSPSTSTGSPGNTPNKKSQTVLARQDRDASTPLDTGPQPIPGQSPRNTRGRKRNITVFKKKNTKVNSENIRNHVYRKSVIVESDNLQLSDCVSLMEADFTIATIIDVTVKEFQQKFDLLGL